MEGFQCPPYRVWDGPKLPSQFKGCVDFGLGVGHRDPTLLGPGVSATGAGFIS